MKRPILTAIACVLFTSPAAARAFPSFRLHSVHPICDQDFSDFRFPSLRGPFVPPEGLEERGLRPSLQYVQQEVCRCLPKRHRHQPSEIRVELHIRPNAGEVTLEYRVEPPWTRPMERMVGCLGEPTLTVEPMPYVTDIVTEDGREEVLGYPILFDLVRASWL